MAKVYGVEVSFVWNKRIVMELIVARQYVIVVKKLGRCKVRNSRLIMKVYSLMS